VNGGLAGLFSPEQSGARVPAKKRPDALFAANTCHVESRGSEVVLQASPGGRLIERCAGRVPRVPSPLLEVEPNTTGACEGSLFAEGVSVGSKRSPFHEVAWKASLAVSLGSSCTASTVVQRG